jgi:lysozyme
MSEQLNRPLYLAETLCKSFEGLRLQPYICPAGYPTIGYGTVYKPDGSKVTLDHPSITPTVALAWLRHELCHNYLPGVLKASPELINYPDALGAITDFAYNLGVPRYRASTLRKRINSLDWGGARAELVKWNKGGGKELRGLVLRRNAEVLLLPK